MMIWYFIVIVNGVIPLFFSSTSTAELIKKLPGQPDGVSFKQHSGYIVTDPRRGHALFYYFVEADARDPSSYPLTLWFNGGKVVLVLVHYCLRHCLPILIYFGLGPGCSSLGFGAFEEHGPFRPAGDGGLTKNEFSWNKGTYFIHQSIMLSWNGLLKVVEGYLHSFNRNLGSVEHAVRGIPHRSWVFILEHNFGLHQLDRCRHRYI